MPDLALGPERPASTTTVRLDPAVKALGVVTLSTTSVAKWAVRTLVVG